MDNRLAAAQHARSAAHHLAAGGDRAGYWRLLGEADLCVGRSADWALQLATRYDLGVLTPEAGQAPLSPLQPAPVLL